MSHRSEQVAPLTIQTLPCHLWPKAEDTAAQSQVWLVALPRQAGSDSQTLGHLRKLADALDEESVFCVLTSPPDAARICAQLSPPLRFQLWVAVRTPLQTSDSDAVLPGEHWALLIFSKYDHSLRHTKTRIAYTYCPHCDRTTKDYGGKKHTYDPYGTLLSDVWRDIVFDPDGSLDEIIHRLGDMFGLAPHTVLNVLDRRDVAPTFSRSIVQLKSHPLVSRTKQLVSSLMNEDCLSALKHMPDDSVDFCFADPPYNLDKKYDRWDDAQDIRRYFDWCDTWLSQLARVLRPGGTVAILNIPQWSVRHFSHLDNILQYQAWIAWEGLSLPVRLIMPAHYAIICFSKGSARPLPGLQRRPVGVDEKHAMRMLKHFYCNRPTCVASRSAMGVEDRCGLTDLWWDIHRLKHNSRRVDHPCQLPPALMYRLISLFTREDELVLDPFNGAGTTSLCADQLNRRYIGIELSAEYHAIARQRHELLHRGEDPFSKQSGAPRAKNSKVRRIGQIAYAVPKKTLQLEVRNIAASLGRLPTRNEVAERTQYDIRYFDEYFVSWGEVCAAARNAGMSELRKGLRAGSIHQPTLFEYPVGK